MFIASSSARRPVAFSLASLNPKLILPLLLALFVQTSQAAEPNGATFNGSLPGEFNVSPSGAATYSIPIEVPTGIGGMQPNLSLEYNSQSGNGLLGVGWSLGGLSAITRCPSTFEQDGFIDGVDFDSNDRFCLDGQRLVPVTNVNCAGGTEYRTETESYARVCSYGAQGIGPAWFKVWTKSGQIIDYGSTPDSKFEAQGRTDILTWSIASVNDSVGNIMSLGYQKITADGLGMPVEIGYGRSDGITSTLFVRFTYEERADARNQYISGSKIRLSKRLKSVSTHANNTQIRNYTLVYDQDGVASTSRMVSISSCDTGLGCLQDINLKWVNEVSGNLSQRQPTVPGWVNSPDAKIYPGDYNGDGRTDFFMTHTGWQSSGVTAVLLANDSGGWTMSQPSVPSWVNSPDAKIYPGDYNGDGLTDFFMTHKDWQTSGLSAIFLSNGQGGWVMSQPTVPGWVNSPDATIYPGDYNGDGRTDYFMTHTGWQTSGLSGVFLANDTGGWTIFQPSVPGWVNSPDAKIYPGDYNGDGLTDFFMTHTGWQTSGLTAVFLSNGQGGWVMSQPTVPSWVNSPDAKIYPGDFNGDGLTDFFMTHTGWEASGLTAVFLSNGQGGWVMSQPAVPGWVNSLDATIYIGDYNGDGLTDFFMTHKGWQTSGLSAIFLSNSQGTWSISQPPVASWVNSPDANLYPGDYNGDGLTDVFLTHKDWLSSGITTIYENAGIAGGLVSEISSDSKIRAKVTYDKLSRLAYYGREFNLPYPMVGLENAMSVATNVISDNGSGDTISSSYRYEGLKAHLRGRGMLGFRKVTSTDDQTGIVNVTTYNQDFVVSNRARDYAKVGAVDSAETILNGVLLSKTTNTYSVTTPVAGRYQLFVDGSTTNTYELNGTLVSTVTTNNQQYDAYGNPQRIDVTTTDGNETYTKTTLNTYSNDTVQWYLGRLLSATVTSTGPPGTETRSSAFEYDYSTGLLSAEIIEPGDPQLSLRTEYLYDTYGNKRSVTVKDSGSNVYPLTTATSTTSYDYSQLGAGTYSITSTNAKGHSETQVIDARFGKPLSLTGPNGLTTQWQYDSFGRQVREIRADGTETTQSMAWCDSGCAGVATAVYKVTTQSSGSAATSVYYDSLGRELRSQAVNLDGRTVYKDTQYNNLGQVTRVSRPYFANTTPQWADYLYDSIGRAWKETAPDGGISETTYNGLTTSVRRYSTSASYNQTTTRVNNVEGNLLKVIDEGTQTTTYAYDPFGNLTRVTDPVNNVIAMAYDKRGRKTSMDDPDMGHWEYKYDAAGQLRWQKDAKNQVVTMAYDVLGRMTSRVEPEGTSTWFYDQVGTKGIGKPWKVTGPNGYVEQYRYDSKGRPDRVTNTIAGSTFYTTTTFDGFGRVDKLTYPSGFILQHLYNAKGYLDKVRNATTTSEVYWTAQEASPDGQISLEQLGNGLQTVRTFDPQSGRMTYLGTYAGSNNVQMLNYRYDALGNLERREDVNQNLTETFQYDEFNRLTQSNIVGVGTKTWAYDGIGNIKAKDGYTDYTYGTAGTKPHAVTAARGNTYAYDSNGNMTSGAGRVITWNSDNKPTRITKGTTTVDFKYGPDRQRYQQVKTVGSQTTTTLYVGKLYEQESKGGVTTYKNFISAGGRTVAIRETVNGTSSMKYLHQDHLGSTDVITNASGQVQERTSFDAFGSRRVASTWNDPVGALTSLFSTRGYTGHEQLDDVGLIHMNGRVYDPALGRFISADPIVQYPAGAQGLNRYSYVDNNPLSRVDPSGYGWLSKTWKKVKKVFKNEIFQAVVTVAAGFLCGPGCAALANTTFAKINGATWGQAFKTGLVTYGTALAFHGVGGLGEADTFFSGLHAGKIALHGLVGGVSARLQGGSFRSGFMSAGFAQGFAPGISRWMPGANQMVGRVVATAVIGGTASEIGGGKFANGAVTGAFSRLFNDETGIDDVESELKEHPERKAGKIHVDSIESVGRDSIPGGKGVGFVITRVLRALDVQSPHEHLGQSRIELENFYYRKSSEQVRDVCYRCHAQ